MWQEKTPCTVKKYAETELTNKLFKAFEDAWAGNNHWAQSVLRSLSMDRQIKTDQIFHIWDCRRDPKASFIKGVERSILNIANYSIVRLDREGIIQKSPT